MRKVNYAVIGVGGVGRVHVQFAKELENINLVAIADIKEDVGKKVSEEFKVKWYKDYREMLEKEDIDAVSVAVPHFLHASMTVDILKNYKKHVLVEKPIAITVKEADEMINAAKANDLKLAVCFQRRLDGISMAVHELVSSGKLGDLIRATMLHLDFRDMIYYGRGAWRGTWSGEGGGVLINQGIHTLDLFLWIAQEKPKKLFSFTNNLLHDIEVEDVASASLLFENGAQAVLQFSCFDNPGKRYMNFRYENAIIEVDKVARVAYTPGLKDMVSGKVRCNTVTIEWEEIKPKTLATKGHKGVLYDFADAILNDREPFITGEEGLKSLEVVNAIIMSAVLHKPVDLPVDREEYEKVWEKLKEAKSIRAFQ